MDDVRRLVLRRKAGEQIVIGEQVVVEIVSFTDGGVRLCIKAPRRVVVRRAELQPEPADSVAGSFHQPRGDFQDHGNGNEETQTQRERIARQQVAGDPRLSRQASDAGPTEVVAAMKADGIDCGLAHVSNIKARLRQGPRRQTRSTGEV